MRSAIGNALRACILTSGKLMTITPAVITEPALPGRVIEDGGGEFADLEVINVRKTRSQSPPFPANCGHDCWRVTGRAVRLGARRQWKRSIVFVRWCTHVDQFGALDCLSTPGEGGAGRLLDVHLHQLATAASVCPSVGPEI